MEKEMILLKKLSIGYRQKTDSRKVLKDINLSIFSGELVCLLGPNGIGKSTLLRTLSGLLPKLSGTIMINGRALEEYSEKELSKQVGVVLTDHPQLRNMRVEELVALGRAPYTNFFGGLSSEDKVFVDEAISLVGIDKLRGRMIRELSDGERQKVMIARADLKKYVPGKGIPTEWTEIEGDFNDLKTRLSYAFAGNNISIKLQESKTPVSSFDEIFEI